MGTGFLLKKESIYSNKDFMLLLLGKIISNIGNAIHSVAVTWYILTLVGEQGSGTLIALLSICIFIPTIIFGPISGVFVDKINRKKIIVGTDYIRGVLILILALLTYLEIVPLISLFIITSLNALFGTFFNPAVSASIPNVVHEDHLVKANSLNGMTVQLSFILGTAIAGFLYMYIGILGIFILNGISFILSGVSEMFINIPDNTKERNTEDNNFNSTFIKDFKEGIKYIKGQRAILILLGFALVLNFLFNPIAIILLPKIVKFTLGLGSKEYGIIEAMFSVGAIAGMLLISFLPKREKYYKMFFTGLFGTTIFILLFGIPILPMVQSKIGNYNIFIIYCSAIFVMMIFNMFVNVPLNTIFQKRVSDEYRGRFFGVLNTLTQGIVPIGLGIVGVLSDVLHPSVFFITSGVLSLILVSLMLFVPDLKEL